MTETETQSMEQFEQLLEYLKQSRGFDFTGYKRTSLMRRVKKRLQMVEIGSFTDYIDYLEVHPEEFSQLFNTILINVTSFFRDGAPWEYLRDELIPRVLEPKRYDQPVRAWVAGCSSGEEALTVAILLTEVMGDAAFRDRAKIYATDVDEEALNHARLASYSAKELESLPEPYREKYFEVTNRHYTFRKDLRRSIIYGRHDLVQDAPISRIDLLTCRNTLMYFNAEAQARILTHFHFALNDAGFLFLGKSEMLLTHANLFQPVDLKRRMFTKVRKNGIRERLLLMAQLGNEDAASAVANHVRLRDSAVDAAPVAQIVVDAGGTVAVVNQQARALFGIAQTDVGRPLQDLEVSYRPVELRSRIERAAMERQPVTIHDVEWAAAGERRYFQLTITPLYYATGGLCGFSIAFTDVTHARRLQDELQHSKHELETAYEELQSTVEELETTNEELQSTNEELETMNEELQSTNEELETMNEELQSTNEELETINDELRQRTSELNQVNAFMSGILGSLRNGVAVVDGELRVQVWNHRAEDLWGLRTDEVQGEHFLNLDIGLPVEQLRAPMRRALFGESDGEEVTVEAITRRGKAVECRVVCTPMPSLDGKAAALIVVMEEKES